MAAVTQPLKTIVLPAIKNHSATVIFVHGLGDTGFGWKPVADMFQHDPALHHVKWILPHSPKRSVTANMGIEMPSWFDIYSFGFDTEEDAAGMEKSKKLISELIDAEIKAGTDPNRIVLGGFSQGAAMSLLTGLTGDRKLAGVAALSGWLPLLKKFKTLASKDAASIPVFWGHGEMDTLVKLPFAKGSAELLINEVGIPRASGSTEADGVAWNLYKGIGHGTNQLELDNLKEWIKKAIPAEAPTKAR